MHKIFLSKSSSKMILKKSFLPTHFEQLALLGN